MLFFCLKKWFFTDIFYHSKTLISSEVFYETDSGNRSPSELWMH